MPNIEVISKYFSKEAVMDESLCEFQEKKNLKTGPKNLKKISKSIGKKVKRIKGQKDIRTLVKNNQSEVVSYTKDFNKVCKQAGVDIDSEQLQLAIALSKSVQEQESLPENEPQVSSCLTSQERTLKIRRTLQEYGFKVPKTKITANANRKKKINKQYKLLLISESERQQNISDKYAEILVNNICASPIKDTNAFTNYDQKIYFKSTNISYKLIKNDNVYYVEELFTKPSNKVCLLRDWSEIPGRPLSPKLEESNINFYDIECSQDELDSILSGSVLTAQQIVRNKTVNKSICSNNATNDLYVHELKANKDELSTNLCDNVNNNMTEHKVNRSHLSIDIDSHKNKLCVKLEVSEFHQNADELLRNSGNVDNNITQTNNNTQISIKKDSDAQNMLSVLQQARCVSPDLFDDEVTVIFDSNNIRKSSENTVLPSQTYFMDLTECVNTNPSNVDTLSKTKLKAPNTNMTKRKSNDFMEITECAVTNSAQVIHLDLTNSCNNSNILDDKPKILENENIDLTQSSNSDDDLPFIDIIHTKKDETFEDTILLDDCDIIKAMTTEKIKTFSGSYNDEPIRLPISPEHKENLIDNRVEISREGLTEKSLISKDENKKTNIYKSDGKESFTCYKNNEVAPSHDVEILIEESTEKSPISKDENEITNIYDSEYNENFTCYKNNEVGPSHDGINIDFKANGSLTCKQSELICTVDDNNSSHSFLAKVDRNFDAENENSFNYTYNSPEKNHYNEYEPAVIDLTQNYDSEKDSSDNANPNTEAVNVNLGKIDNISIDYDEIFDDIVKNSKSSISQTSLKTSDCEMNSTKHEDASVHSKNSEVFDVSDKDFNYTIQKLANDGDCSSENILSTTDLTNKFHENSDKSLLPFIPLESNTCQSDDIIRKQKLIPCNEFSTPPRASKENVIITNIETPENNEYLIKTNDVTPMLDYASMSSPERNKELDKYGLRPFKRKRAIQLLTYLYNQTHPIVEALDDCASPSKRQKRDSEIGNKSPKKTTKSPKKTTKSPKKTTKSPKKTSKSPKKTPSTEKERSEIPIPDINEDIYAMTKELPDIKVIQCSEEDLVFQKREKAKVHSCRVPLHIAFHNYVTCRRRLREAILKYEPINIDVVHRDLVASGHKYNPKDLLKFLDKKCITVKTADNNARNRKS